MGFLIYDFGFTIGEGNYKGLTNVRAILNKEEIKMPKRASFTLFLTIIIFSFLMVGCGTNQPSTPDEYVSEYGGNREVYAQILSMTDCIKLQEQFDLASQNNSRETPGTPEFKWTTGYMVAADNTMKKVGCYK
jgi:hypothetical protein